MHKKLADFSVLQHFYEVSQILISIFCSLAGNPGSCLPARISPVSLAPKQPSSLAFFHPWPSSLASWPPPSLDLLPLSPNPPPSSAFPGPLAPWPSFLAFLPHWLSSLALPPSLAPPSLAPSLAVPGPPFSHPTSARIELEPRLDWWFGIWILDWINTFSEYSRWCYYMKDSEF